MINLPTSEQIQFEFDNADSSGSIDELAKRIAQTDIPNWVLGAVAEVFRQELSKAETAEECEIMALGMFTVGMLFGLKFRVDKKTVQ